MKWIPEARGVYLYVIAACFKSRAPQWCCGISPCLNNRPRSSELGRWDITAVSEPDCVLGGISQPEEPIFQRWVLCRCSESHQGQDTLGILLTNLCVWRDRRFRCKCPNSRLDNITWEFTSCSLFSKFECYVSPAALRAAAPISKQMWRRKTSKGVSEQGNSMSIIFPNSALCSHSWARPPLSK